MKLGVAAVIGGATGGLIGAVSVAILRSDVERLGNLAEWVGGVGTALALVIAARVLRGELEVRGEQKKLETIRFVTEQLQNDEERRDLRGVLYEKFVGGAGVDDHEYRRAAEDSAHRLNTIGILVREGVLDPGLVQRNWGEQIARCYLASEALINWRIEREAHPQLWDAFRELARQALSEGRGHAWRESISATSRDVHRDAPTETLDPRTPDRPER